MKNWWKPWTWHFHRCITKDDDSGVWGECIVCGQRFGFVSRDTLRRYIDREVRDRIRRPWKAKV